MEINKSKQSCDECGSEDKKIQFSDCVAQYGYEAWPMYCQPCLEKALELIKLSDSDH